MSTGRREPSERQRAISLLVIGLVLVLATPFLLPAGVAAIVVALMLARRGYNTYAMVVLLPAVFALVFVILASVRHSRSSGPRSLAPLPHLRARRGRGSRAWRTTGSPSSSPAGSWWWRRGRARRAARGHQLAAPGRGRAPRGRVATYRMQQSPSRSCVPSAADRAAVEARDVARRRRAANCTARDMSGAVPYAASFSSARVSTRGLGIEVEVVGPRRVADRSAPCTSRPDAASSRWPACRAAARSARRHPVPTPPRRRCRPRCRRRPSRGRARSRASAACRRRRNSSSERCGVAGTTAATTPGELDHPGARAMRRPSGGRTPRDSRAYAHRAWRRPSCDGTLDRPLAEGRNPGISSSAAPGVDVTGSPAGMKRATR